jgi:hypothetical protein
VAIALLSGAPTGHADSYSCGDQCNGQIPSFDNPDCWPTAIYCSAPGTPEDRTVCGYNL